MDKPLKGIRVVELSIFVAAPVCARLLADMGAEVIKVEHPNGDGWRYRALNYKPDVYNEQHNPVFDIYNSGKQHIALNLKTPEGMEAMHKLLETADVFLTNTRPAALDRLGLGYEQIKEKYPKLIYAIILGYGEKGPDAAEPAFDGTAFWSRGGFLRDMPDAENYMPISPPSGMGDTITGYLLMGQINAALYRRTRDGKGELVKSGLYHNAVFTMGTMNIAAQDPNPDPMPHARKDGPCNVGAYGCSDGEWIYYARGTVKEVEFKVVRMLGLDFLLDDPRYATVETRHEHRDYIYPLIRDAFLSKPSDHWITELRKLGIAAMRMQRFSDVCKDEQAWANDYLEYMQFPDGTTGIMPTTPLEMESVGQVPSKPAGKVGEHTVEILRSLGYPQEKIDAMIEAGSVAIESQMKEVVIGM